MRSWFSTITDKAPFRHFTVDWIQVGRPKNILLLIVDTHAWCCFWYMTSKLRFCFCSRRATLCDQKFCQHENYFLSLSYIFIISKYPNINLWSEWSFAWISVIIFRIVPQYILFCTFCADYSTRIASFQITSFEKI